MEAKRESTKSRCYNFLAMCCDGYLKNRYTNKEVATDFRIRVALLCEILKIDPTRLNHYRIVKKYRPDLFEQDFYDDMRKYIA
jgi:hypothetical protein